MDNIKLPFIQYSGSFFFLCTMSLISKQIPCKVYDFLIKLYHCKG